MTCANASSSMRRNRSIAVLLLAFHSIPLASGFGVSSASVSRASATQIAYQKLPYQETPPVVDEAILQPQHVHIDQQQQQQQQQQPVDSSRQSQEEVASRTAPHPPIRDLACPLELLDAIDATATDDSHPNYFTVVEYYADYCQICQRAGLTYAQLATSAQRNNWPVSFRRFEASKHKIDPAHLDQLDVPMFPYVQIFCNGHCVASLRGVPVAQFRDNLAHALQECLDKSPNDWRDFWEEHADTLQHQQQARSQVRHELVQAAAAAEKRRKKQTQKQQQQQPVDSTVT